MVDLPGQAERARAPTAPADLDQEPIPELRVRSQYRRLGGEVLQVRSHQSVHRLLRRSRSNHPGQGGEALEHELPAVGRQKQGGQAVDDGLDLPQHAAVHDGQKRQGVAGHRRAAGQQDRVVVFPVFSQRRDAAGGQHRGHIEPVKLEGAGDQHIVKARQRGLALQ